MATKDTQVWSQVGVSLQADEMERFRMCIGNESPGWVLRQLLYEFVVAAEQGRRTMPDRRTSPVRMPSPTGATAPPGKRKR